MRVVCVSILVLLLAACGGGNNAANSAAGSPTGNSSARVDGQVKPLVAAAAGWHASGGKLQIALASFTPPAEMLAAMADPRPEGDMAIATEPYVTLTIVFNDAAGKLDTANIKNWTLTFDLFEGGPMTFMRNTTDTFESLEADVREGGSVSLVFKLKEDFQVGSDPVRNYECNISQKIPLKVYQ